MGDSIKQQRVLAGIEEASYATAADTRTSVRRYTEALVELREAAKHIEHCLRAMNDAHVALANEQPILKKRTTIDMSLALDIRRKMSELEQNLTRSETNVRNFSGAHPVPKKVWGLF